MDDYSNSFENYYKNDGYFSQRNYYNQSGEGRFYQKRDIARPHYERNICHHRHFLNNTDDSSKELERFATQIPLQGLCSKKVCYLLK